ncbi:MAG TPA: YebC/PmpR family DNA-binding transcriptional regulator [Actinomycetota bacterium]|nr:YebC/PmpR family DNA-binding transcriptional regulator [Actinomycetota bacterium]
MSGHSKWATTKHQKAVKDARRGKLFAKTIRIIEVAAREGGGNPEANPTLADAIQRARAISMPNDTIDRAVKRGTGELEGVKYETLTYEGYGPGGVALLLEVLTDNRNRAAADVRRVFTKNGGTLGDPGSVAWMFTRKGVVLIPKDSVGEDELMLAAMDAGADDITQDGDYWQVVCAPTELQQLKNALAEAGIEPESARFSMEPNATIPLDKDAADKVLKLMDALDDEEDVQEVYSNFEISDEVLAELNA